MNRLRTAVCSFVLAGSAIAAWRSSIAHATVPRAQIVNPRAIAAGDVVFFRTTTWRGRIVGVLQQDRDDFTHVGIVTDVNAGEVRVVHASPAQPAIVRIDPLSDLLNWPEVATAAIYRPRVSQSEAVRAARIAERYARRKTPFDDRFDLGNDRAVYCTELVWIAYRNAGLRIDRSHSILFPPSLLHAGFFDPVPGVIAGGGL